MLSAIVHDQWFSAVARADVPETPGILRVAIDATLPRSRRVMVLEPTGAGGIVTLAPDVAARLGLRAAQTIDSDALQRALAGAAIALNGADALCYLPADAQTQLATETPDAFVRQLTQDDAALFAGLEAAAPADDLDEAFVELDHWLVLGAVIDDRLACAASMLRWNDTRIADVGVITLPEHRRRGLARAVVRAIAAHAIRLGFEPQYRCQLDNAPSLALAASCGFEVLATWDVVAEDD